MSNNEAVYPRDRKGKRSSDLPVAGRLSKHQTNTVRRRQFRNGNKYHQDHRSLDLVAQDTPRLSSTTPGAKHVQPRENPSSPEEWDDVSEQSDDNHHQEVSSDLQVVVTASLVPNEEDVEELMEKSSGTKIQQAIVVEATSLISTDQAKNRRYRCVVLLLVVMLMGVVTGITLNYSSSNKKEVPTWAVPPMPVNYVCSAAYTIESGMGSIQGSINESPEPYVNNSCSFYQFAPTGTSWYSLKGDGKVYIISTCSSDLNFDSVVSVFSGSCDTKECVTIDTFYSNVCNETLFKGGKVMFHSVAGIEYFISVESTNSAMQGVFRLSISTLEPPSNDFCSDAEAIDPRVGITHGSISNATPSSYSENSYGICDEIYYVYGRSGPGPNVWYSLLGDDQAYVISTCSSDLSFASGLTVSTGPCDALECVTVAFVNDLVCETTSSGAASVLFLAKAGIQYFISVENYERTNEGTFSLSISTVDTPSNNFCSSAEKIDPSVGIIHGSITNATSSFLTEYSCSFGLGSDSDWLYTYDYDGLTPNVWYSLLGDDNVYLISTCSSELNFASAISVSAGSCDAPECITWAITNDINCEKTSSRAARVLFRAMAGVEYFISVENLKSTIQGDFGLVVSTVVEPWNDVCGGAQLIQLNSGVIYASTYNATDSLTNISLGYQMHSDLWYRVEGDGTLLTASTCGEETFFDTQLSVFEGLEGECDHSLIVTTVEYCTIGLQVEWFAEAGSTYYIRVYGYNGSSGSFQLNIF